MVVTEFAVAAMGEDRPGIVAATGEALSEIGASIDDSAMTILGGHFAMLLHVQAPGAAALETALGPVRERFDLLLEVRETATSQAATPASAQPWVISAYGPDRPGLVTALARVLADNQANITDFGSRVTGGDTFTMWFNVDLAADANIDDLRAKLAAAGGGVELHVDLHQVDEDAL